MAKYLFKRILHGIFSLVVVVAIVMLMIYSLMDRNLIFAKDTSYTHLANNAKEVYKYERWEEYGYIDHVSYADYLTELVKQGEMTEAEREEAVAFGRTEAKDSKIVSEYIEKFTEYYEGQGYEIKRLDAVTDTAGRKLADGGRQQLFAFRDEPLLGRLWGFFSGLISVEDINAVSNDVGERGITFTLYDPLYGGEKFSPAIIGNGTYHKYLLYFDSKFPYIHQNIVDINLGTSYSVNKGVDVFDTMLESQGAYVQSTITYPTGHTELSADDLHTATYQSGARDMNPILKARFTDNYTGVTTVKGGMSKMAYSFIIGIISVALAYFIGIPVGLVMARKKDKLVDKLGTAYIMFIIAVPSLAYIFLFKAIGTSFRLPGTFMVDSKDKLMYILPIVSLALPSIANQMKWGRRYMIDQMNSDYVKFARSGGLTEAEIFSKHILKNAAIPIVHGIPGAVIYAITGAIITERVYVVPGTGNLLTTAINQYDNGVIVGLALFYAVLSIVSIILGDVLMATIDPRISFTTKDR